MSDLKCFQMFMCIVYMYILGEGLVLTLSQWQLDIAYMYAMV